MVFPSSHTTERTLVLGGFSKSVTKNSDKINCKPFLFQTTRCSLLHGSLASVTCATNLFGLSSLSMPAFLVCPTCVENASSPTLVCIVSVGSSGVAALSNRLSAPSVFSSALCKSNSATLVGPGVILILLVQNSVRRCVALPGVFCFSIAVRLICSVSVRHYSENRALNSLAPPDGVFRSYSDLL